MGSLLMNLFRVRVFKLLLAVMLAATLLPNVMVRGEGILLSTGNYYYSVVPDGGNSPDKGATGLVSSSEGVLFDGSSATYAGWMGSATSKGTVQVAFDLLKDYPLDSIKIVMNAPNQYWGFKEFTVKYRSEAVTDYYYIGAKHVREGTNLNNTVTIPMSNKTARFIVMDIKRSHAYQHIPLTEVQIYKGTGNEGQNPGPALTVQQMQAEMKKDARMVDKYGQWIYETWPGKVTSDAQLQQEYADEAAALANVSLDLDKYDQYGGLKNGGQYEQTGFFRLQQINGKWWFITPDGRKFILKGVDAASIREWGYGTALKKADGTPRQVFEELPDPSAYAPAYANDANGERVSFVVANVMRKYGNDYEAKWEDITKKRLINWGFNAFSKWTRPQNITFPYIQVLQDPGDLRRIQWTYDVFDPQSESKIENALSSQLQSAKNDPWLIGYTYDNEAGWSADIVKEVLTYNSSSPAKNAFVDFLAPRYNNDITLVNQLLGTNAGSFAVLKDTSINITKVPAADVSEYIKLASRTYFSTIQSIIRKYDTNHLFLGASIVPTWRTSLDWDSAAMEYVDAFSVDNYTNDAGWISRYESYGKPLLNLEYSFGTAERGLSPVNAATKVGSIAARGEAFKAFIESQIEHPLFVGSGWFTYYDQAVTGRKDGENFNIGLLSQQDQPYTDMVNMMKTVNASLENIHDQPGPDSEAPSAPANVTDISSGSQIDLNWTASTDNVEVAGYIVYRDGVEAGRTTEASYADTNLQALTTYTYLVKAYDAADNISDASNTASVTTFAGSPVKYEAENAALSGAQVDDHYAGYSGTGYADYMTSSGDFVEWTVQARAAGEYGLTFRYANGGSGDRPLRIAVNGTEVDGSLSFPPTGSWSAWSTTSITVPLQAGNNTVRATATGSSGSNVDALTVALQQLQKTEASIAYIGDQVAEQDEGALLSARVIQSQDDGIPRELEGLPVQFVLSQIHSDGSVVPLPEATAAQGVYATDADGNVTVRVQLSPGLYVVTSKLLDNEYFKTAETVSYLAVYDAMAQDISLNGHINLDQSSSFIGEGAKKIHFNVEVSHTTGMKTFRIHAEPQGLDWTMDTVDWLVVSEHNVILQGGAEVNNERYTVRLLLGSPQSLNDGDVRVTLQIWKNDGGVMEYQAEGELRGSVKLF